MEMDDVHRRSILHPGPVIWPCILDDRDCDFEFMLDAAIVGYEATIIVGETFDRTHYGFYHNTATAGVFGATAAFWPFPDEEQDAQLTGDNLQRLVSALGLAGTMSSGLWQLRHEVGDTKQWHIARAVKTGLDASVVAFKGIKGPRFILEGPQGLYAATCNAPKPMAFLDQWRIHEVSFKPWGACRHAHPAIDAALELKEKIGSLEGAIQVETYSDAITFCDRLNPETANDAKFSIQHSVAVVAERGVPQLADFEPEAIAALADARSRVTVSEASHITALYPEHYGARVTCGRESVELLNTLGDPERPLAKDGIIDKAKALISWGGLPEKEADRAVDLALHGDDSAAIHKMLENWLS
ncbi:MmgE/PrpD family protein [Parasphingorhabdus sp.]|uniref:MmgE/PrpD family protein n=1 Tax=Parasphingorhabdus sp. TaxID=2709688 RepID=UPI003A9293B5